MRVADRPIPAYTPHVATNVTWPVSLHVLLEGDAAPLLWDEPEVNWDDPRAIWDALQLTAEFDDITCDLAGADIQHGPPDELQLMPAGACMLTLDNRSGEYTRYNPDGTLSNTQLGKRLGLVVNAEAHPDFAAGSQWWLYLGRITSWVEGADETVEVTAHNVVNDMTPQAAFTAAGTTVQARLPNVVAAGKVVDPLVRSANGTVTLTVQATTRSPWEEAQAVALSDGGIVFADADDAVMYLNRDWRSGRTDQAHQWSLTDNACGDAEVVVWHAELSTNDEELVTSVLLTNVAGLTATAALVPNLFGTESVRKHPDPDQWSTQAQGDALAADTLAKFSVPMVALSVFQVMADDPRFDLWRLAIDTRIGDRLTFVHDYKPDGQLTVGGIINNVAHSITPEQWIVTLSAWAFKLEAPAVWGTALWGVSLWGVT